MVTGWVISGIGKWVTTASAGFFLSDTYNIVPIKLDGYLNIDPGTMNPHEHGEVFVLSDGAEVDMDFGHYERFLGVKCSWEQSISMWKVYADILDKERRGDFLWKTVQMVPHVTNHIFEKIQGVFERSGWDICMIEVGGTVWDIEVELYLEAIRQMKQSLPREDFFHIHLTYVPIPGWVDEQKTKPTQQSVALLQSKGLFPDAIMARGTQSLTQVSRDKIAMFSNVSADQVFSIPDVSSIYAIPELLKKQQFHTLLFKQLQLNTQANLLEPLTQQTSHKIDIWNSYLQKEKKQTITIGVVWKYMALEDSYSSVVEALKHVGHTQEINIDLVFINTRDNSGIDEIKKCDGCIVPGGFGATAVENMITALKYLRENKIPTLWICLGLQLMIIEYARNVLSMMHANSLEFDPNCAPADVITLLENQKWIVNKGGTMRLGEQNTHILPWQIQTLYQAAGRAQQYDMISERFRHRYEVHPEFAKKLKGSDMQVSWLNQREWIVQFIEMLPQAHPYYVATQAHPELTSKLEDPAPLFVWLAQACMALKK